MVAPAYAVDALGGVKPIDDWHWFAHLRDGTIIPEQDADGRLRSFTEVDAADVITLELRPLDGGPPLLLEIPPGATAWLGRKRSMRLDQATGATVYEGCLTMLNWRLPDGRACWLYRRADGLVAITDREVT